ncbi:Rieske (2Fe-2S) protein [Roseomonas sp. KE2513]|uniref:Rieske (2Fe-2S) protein n=1 Tax=Roseomonas sp. KE2513 TaxID=2479202 RepID=UPI0018DFC3F4|nr:Rieske 2Fe-2S domain-containing protein [Roseomonas sp. KE2513]MBI0538952.1 Rieske (2Fe-2S) protein [Roseomonas sp. KE2513]
MSERALCRLEEIPDGTARGFPPVPGGFTSLVVLRQGETVRVYVNACPHLGIPLEPLPNRFLDGTGRYLVCSTHGARFRVEDGFCTSGPCTGDRLEAVPVRLERGVILVPADAGV